MVCGIICMKSRQRPSLLLKPALLWTAGSPSINRKCLDQFICKRAHILENRRNLGYCAFLCFLLLLLFMDVLRPLPLSALTQRLGQGRSCRESGSKVWWGKVPRLGMAYSIVWCPKGRSGKKKKKKEKRETGQGVLGDFSVSATPTQLWPPLSLVWNLTQLCPTWSPHFCFASYRASAQQPEWWSF